MSGRCATAAPAPALERLLRRDRAIALAGVVALCVLAWAYVLAGAGMGAPAWRMTTLPDLSLPGPGRHAAPAAQPAPSLPAPNMPAMNMPAGGAGSTGASAGGWWLAVGMWASMMVAMMTPSAAPAILLYARVARGAGPPQSDRPLVASPAVFTGGYLLLWLVFSLAAASVQQLLLQRGWISGDLLDSRSRGLSAALFGLAGLYQLTPWRDACLRNCRSPASFFARHWRPGAWGAVRLGVLHGLYCVGCCWALMALLFVGGVMNLLWIAGLTTLVMAEKLLRRGVWIGRASGLLLLAAAGVLLLR